MRKCLQSRRRLRDLGRLFYWDIDLRFERKERVLVINLKLFTPRRVYGQSQRVKGSFREWSSRELEGSSGGSSGELLRTLLMLKTGLQ